MVDQEAFIRYSPTHGERPVLKVLNINKHHTKHDEWETKHTGGWRFSLSLSNSYNFSSAMLALARVFFFSFLARRRARVRARAKAKMQTGAKQGKAR